MQFAVPEATAIDGESESTRRSYGLESEYEPTRIFGRECLLARRLVERGVRFIECTCPQVTGDRWDQHENLEEGHANNARAVDQPIAAAPAGSQAAWPPRIHPRRLGRGIRANPVQPGDERSRPQSTRFTMWLAGGGIEGGRIHATDELGYRAVDRPVEIHDLHATMLHLMGIDHERLTSRFGGRDMRLTDVHGTVMHDWFA